MKRISFLFWFLMFVATLIGFGMELPDDFEKITGQKQHGDDDFKRLLAEVEGEIAKITDQEQIINVDTDFTELGIDFSVSFDFNQLDIGKANNFSELKTIIEQHGTVEQFKEKLVWPPFGTFSNNHNLLVLSVMNGNYKIVDFLLSGLTDLQNPKCSENFRVDTISTVETIYGGKIAKTALLAAVQNLDIEMVNLLLKYEADPRNPQAPHTSALFTAAALAEQNGKDKKLIKQILQNLKDAIEKIDKGLKASNENSKIAPNNNSPKRNWNFRGSAKKIKKADERYSSITDLMKKGRTSLQTEEMLRAIDTKWKDDDFLDFMDVFFTLVKSEDLPVQHCTYVHHCYGFDAEEKFLPENRKKLRDFFKKFPEMMYKPVVIQQGCQLSPTQLAIKKANFDIHAFLEKEATTEEKSSKKKSPIKTTKDTLLNRKSSIRKVNGKNIGQVYKEEQENLKNNFGKACNAYLDAFANNKEDERYKKVKADFLQAMDSVWELSLPVFKEHIEMAMILLEQDPELAFGQGNIEGKYSTHWDKMMWYLNLKDFKIKINNKELQRLSSMPLIRPNIK